MGALVAIAVGGIAYLLMGTSSTEEKKGPRPPTTEDVFALGVEEGKKKVLSEIEETKKREALEAKAKKKVEELNTETGDESE